MNKNGWELPINHRIALWRVSCARPTPTLSPPSPRATTQATSPHLLTRARDAAATTREPQWRRQQPALSEAAEL